MENLWDDTKIGDITHVRYSNRAWSDDEIKELYEYDLHFMKGWPSWTKISLFWYTAYFLFVGFLLGVCVGIDFGRTLVTP